MQFSSHWHGRVSYGFGQKTQEAGLGASGQIFGFEFDPVITLGKRSEPAVDLCGSVPAEIEICAVERGGHATLHSPGQLVIYPVVSLRDMGWNVRDYVCWLQRVTRDCLKSFGITSRAGEEPGLYTDVGKIAFFGVRIRRGVTQHGVSINVSNDLRLFRHIRSCGVLSESFDRMARHGQFALDEVFEAWVGSAALVSRRLS